MEILYAFSILMIVAISTWLHAHHRRMVAQARLDISKVVLEMETVMLKEDIKVGDICHDQEIVVSDEQCRCVG